jgi:hypothetical protein
MYVPAFLGPWGGGGEEGIPGGYQAEECSIKWGAVDIKWQNENCVARATLAVWPASVRPVARGWSLDSLPEQARAIRLNKERVGLVNMDICTENQTASQSVSQPARKPDS